MAKARGLFEESWIPSLMLSLDEALNRAQSLVDAARKAGADAADAVYGCDASAGGCVRLGPL